MGQFSVQLALCHRVLLISTFFFPTPLRPSREVVLVTSLIVNNSFQWEQSGRPLHAFASGPLVCFRCAQEVWVQCVFIGNQHYCLNVVQLFSI